MSDIRLKDAKYWIDKLAIPLVISFTVLGVTWLVTEKVVYVTAPPNLFNEAYNPFIGTWQNSGAEVYGFNQLIISNEDNLVYAEFFKRCDDGNCSFAKVRAELVGETMIVTHASSEKTLALFMQFRSGDELSIDLTYNIINANGSKSSGQATLGFDRVDSNFNS